MGMYSENDLALIECFYEKMIGIGLIIAVLRINDIHLVMSKSDGYTAKDIDTIFVNSFSMHSIQKELAQKINGTNYTNQDGKQN